MRPSPPEKRAVAFIDGQNLFHAAKAAFGYAYPNYDVRALAAVAAFGTDFPAARRLTVHHKEQKRGANRILRAGALITGHYGV